MSENNVFRKKHGLTFLATMVVVRGVESMKTELNRAALIRFQLPRLHLSITVMDLPPATMYAFGRVRITP